MARPAWERAVYAADGTVLWSTAQALSDALAEQPWVANSVVASLDAATFAWLLTTTNPSSTGPPCGRPPLPFVQSATEAERAVGNVLTRLAGAHQLVAPELRGGLGAVVAPWSGRLAALPRPSYAATWAVASDPVAVDQPADPRGNRRRRCRHPLARHDDTGRLRDVLASGPPTAERCTTGPSNSRAAARISSEQLDDAPATRAWRSGWRLPLAPRTPSHTRRHRCGGPVIATQMLTAVENGA
jgi:hypothetical protein